MTQYYIGCKQVQAFEQEKDGTSGYGVIYPVANCLFRIRQRVWAHLGFLLQSARFGLDGIGNTPQ